MSKGSRRERQAREIYESAGYWVYSPQNPQYGDNDLWNLFDLACFNPKYGQLRFVQVKSNGARGITKWCHLARRFNALSCVLTDFVIPYDREGWRLVRPAQDGHTTVYDEREYSVSMGEGITEFLRGESERPQSELRELVENFRERADHNRSVGQVHDANQIEHCADELEEVIDS